jgi:cytoskeleton protein RodZ
MSVGERLRRARLDAGKTLEQVAAETKIQHWILEALEREDFSRVPGGVFIRGYLTAFARAVGLCPSEIWTAYSQETAPPPVPPLPAPPPDLNARLGSPLWQYAAIAAMVLLGAVLWRNMARSNVDVTAGTASPPLISAPSVAPWSAPGRLVESGATATSGATSPGVPAKPSDADPSALAAAPLIVQLHASNKVWIDATADGERKAYRLFEEGEDLRVEAQHEIRLLVGDAGAVSYTLNGRPGRALGGSGVVRRIVISESTLPTLL